MTINQYKYDIRQRTFQFALDTLRCCKTIKETKREFVITQQLSRSATSVGANLREARNAVSKADFIYKLSISQKECDASVYWIELLIENENDELKRLLAEANELLKIISAIILKTKANAKWSKR